MILQSMCEAGRWPVNLYPSWLRFALTFLAPIAFATTVPAQALAGRLTWGVLLAVVALALALFSIARLFGVWQYSGARHDDRGYLGTDKTGIPALGTLAPFPSRGGPSPIFFLDPQNHNGAVVFALFALGLLAGVAQRGGQDAFGDLFNGAAAAGARQMRDESGDTELLA